MEGDYREHTLQGHVYVEQPSKEHLVEPGVWSVEKFEKHLAAAKEIPYAELPREIWLDGKWHNLINDLTTKTAKDGNEWGTNLVCIDRQVQNPRRVSLPFDYQDHFQMWWGDKENPIFLTEPKRGTPIGAESSTTPSVITWQDQEVATRRVGFVHTHPSSGAFSVGDMLWITSDHTQKTLVAATNDYNFTFLKTADQPVLSSANKEHAESVAYGYAQEKTGQPNWKHRYLGIKDTKHEQRWFQAIFELSHEFCKTYKVGLYGGMPGKPLTRLV